MFVSAEKLRDYLEEDYPLTMEYLETLNSLPLPMAICSSSIKPYTIMTITLANELKVSKRKRIGCAAFVDITGRLITTLDDIVDSSFSRVQRTPDVNSFSYQLGLLASLSACCYHPLYTQIKKRLLGLNKAMEMVEAYCRFAKSMFEGLCWQNKYGYFRFLSHEHVPSVEDIMRHCVDRLSGDLFAWSLDSLRYYEHTLGPRIDDIRAIAYPFGRIFQINDDIVDVPEDLHAGQTTVVLAAIMHIGDREERQNLSKLQNSSEEFKLDPRAFSRLFSKTSPYLSRLKDEEYRRLHRLLEKANIAVSETDLRNVLENYQNLRQSFANLVAHH